MVQEVTGPLHMHSSSSTIDIRLMFTKNCATPIQCANGARASTKTSLPVVPSCQSWNYFCAIQLRKKVGAALEGPTKVTF
jgi:hypothetical protein